jgi:hypothetical protein
LQMRQVFGVNRLRYHVTVSESDRTAQDHGTQARSSGCARTLRAMRPGTMPY